MWDFRSVKIIQLILSQVNGLKWETPRNKNLTTCKQNLAYLTWPELGSNLQQWDSGEMSDIEPRPSGSRIKTF